MYVPHSLRYIVTAARRWPIDSQLGARRNAMIASTALAQRRAERDEVEAFLAALHRAPETTVHVAHG